MSTLKTTTCAAAILLATLSLAGCDRKAGDSSTAPGTSTGSTSGDASKAATPPASPASPASK